VSASHLGGSSHLAALACSSRRRAVPAQLPGRGHDTHLSQRFDQKESRRLEALLMQGEESLPLLWQPK